MILRNLILPILLLVSLPTQVQASKLTEDQLTKKIFVQDEIAKIENRLHELKRRKIKDEDDDDVIGGAGGGGDDVAPRPPRPPTDKVEDLTRRLNILCGNQPRTLYIPRPDIEPDDDIDMQDILNSRFNRLRYDPAAQAPDEKLLFKRLIKREQELAGISKEIVKSRKSDTELFRPVLSDTPSPTPDRDYFLPPPVGPTDNNFIRPTNLDNLPDPPQYLPQADLVDTFARPLTKIVDEKDNTIQIALKKPQVDIKERNLSEQLT